MVIIKDKVRFVETDMMGVVHHANYLRWFEMGRVAYLQECGISLNELMVENIIFPITQVEVKYKNSCFFDDEFAVHTKMSGFNKAKMEFTYQVIRLRDGVVAVEGYTRNVFTDKDGHIVRLEPKWYERIKAVFEKEQ